MNNAQFRKLLETPRPPPSSDHVSSTAPLNPAQRALGSKLRSSIPMTPRSLTHSNTDFARQLAERRSTQPPANKKFKSSAAPKGTKLASGYTDRAAALREKEEEKEMEDERERRLERLRELVKEGEMEHEEYVRQTKLLGGDVDSTRYVKGLDFELLKRVKAGEDLMAKIVGDGDDVGESDKEDELESRLEEVLERDVEVVEKKKEKKIGQKAPQPKTRAEILAELKKQKQAAKEAAQPKLGAGFRKIGQPKEERDEEGEREIKVKHVMGEDGKVKRKVKRKDKERERTQQQQEKGDMLPPPSAQRVMGMMPPPQLSGKAAPTEHEDDDDIFSGVGDYDPLAGIGSDDSDSDSDADAEHSKRPKTSPEVEPAPPPTDSTIMPPPPPPPSTTARHKTLFSDSPSDTPTYTPPTDKASLLASSPDLAAVLHRAAQIGKKLESEDEKKKRKLVEEAERDSYDIDMGFGGSTNFDDDDEEGWGEGGGKKGTKRKRGGKNKGKGNKNDAEVVGRVVEERYGGEGRK